MTNGFDDTKRSPDIVIEDPNSREQILQEQIKGLELKVCT